MTLTACSAPPSGPSSAGGPSAPGDATGASPSGTTQPLVWSACDTHGWPDGFALPSADVTCTSVTVPLDHDHPDDGRTLPLRVARQRAKNGANKAVFQLAGGPGGTSVGQSGTIPRYMPTLVSSFDLVYVDQRGTGGSGALVCAAGYPATKSDWVACAAEHGQDELAHYLTVDAAHDLEAVRIALGYGKISLRAGSYGTRLGLEFMRQHASSIDAIVLDGVDPPDNTFFEDFIRASDRGVDALAADCAKSAACKAITSDVLADLRAHHAAVVKTPRAILVGGLPDKEDEQLFFDALGSALAEADLRFRLPRAMRGAATGDFAAWNAVLGALLGDSVSEPVHAVTSRRAASRHLRRRTHGTSYVSPGLYMAIVCAEDLPNSGGLDSLRTLDAAQQWGGDRSMVDLADACSAWKMKPLAPALRAPVRADVPVLLLGGALDLNTFPEYGAHAAETLTHATNLVIPYATHSTMSLPCVGQVITDFFVAGGDMSKVNTSCIAATKEPAW